MAVVIAYVEAVVTTVEVEYYHVALQQVDVRILVGILRFLLQTTRGAWKLEAYTILRTIDKRAVHQQLAQKRYPGHERGWDGV